MAVTYPPTVSVVADGEKVNAGITNRPTAQLIDRTDYLKARLDALADSLSVVTIFDQPIGDLVLDSQLVYFDSATGKLQTAIAELSASGAPPVFTPTDKNFVVGVVHNIRGLPGSKICDLWVRGRIKSLASANLIETTATVEVGKPYYLTIKPGEAGRCSTTRPSLRVQIGGFWEDGSFLLDPDVQSLGEDHVHFQFSLDNTKWTDLGPSTPLTGTPTFTTASSSVTGVGTLFTTEVSPGDVIRLDADDLWYIVDGVISDVLLKLVVDYAGAGGSSAGSVGVGPWLYSGLELDPFPPIPFESSILVLNGHVLEFGTDYFVDTDGVHLEIATGGPSDDGLTEFQLFYLFPLGQGTAGVTALKSGTDNVRIDNCSPGGPPDTGNLRISVFETIDVLSETLKTNRAIKTLEVDPVTGHLQVRKGPAVEQLLAGTGISLEPTDGVGCVTVSSTGAMETLTHIPHIVLRNAKESIKNLTSYIEMPEGIRSAFFGKIKLPTTLDTSQSLDLVFEMIAETSVLSTATSVKFELSYHILDSGTPDSLNKSKLTLTSTVGLPFPYSAFEIFPRTVFQIPGSQLKPEGTLSFLLKRLDEDDSYDDSVGIVHALYRARL